jgi:hypothetical protein
MLDLDGLSVAGRSLPGMMGRDYTGVVCGPGRASSEAIPLLGILLN